MDDFRKGSHFQSGLHIGTILFSIQNPADGEFYVVHQVFGPTTVGSAGSWGLIAFSQVPATVWPSAVGQPPTLAVKGFMLATSGKTVEPDPYTIYTDFTVIPVKNYNVGGNQEIVHYRLNGTPTGSSVPYANDVEILGMDFRFASLAGGTSYLQIFRNVSITAPVWTFDYAHTHAIPLFKETVHRVYGGYPGVVYPNCTNAALVYSASVVENTSNHLEFKEGIRLKRWDTLSILYYGGTPLAGSAISISFRAVKQ